MGLFKRLFLGIITLVVVAVLVFAGLYIYSFSKIKITDVRVNQLQDVSLTGFTLSGNIDIHNAGLISVNVKHITYETILEASGERLASGLIQGESIPPKQNISFPFSSKINWVPSAETAWNLITPGQTYAKIKGSAIVADLRIIEIKLPFEKRVDLEEYIRQFAKEQAEETITGTVEKIGEGIKSITGKVIDALGGLFG